jgi:hypothetical protein
VNIIPTPYDAREPRARYEGNTMVDRVEQMLRDCGATSVDDAPERLRMLESSPVWPYWNPLDDEMRAAVLARFVPRGGGAR